MTQLDIFGNKLPQKLCKCGCGDPVYGNADYIQGHHMKVPEIAKLQTDQRLQWMKDNPDKVKLKSEKNSQWFEDHPEEAKLQVERRSQYYRDHPEVGVRTGKKIVKWMKDHPEEVEIAHRRHSATNQGQDYDKGEWTGYATNNWRDWSEVYYLNDPFDGCHRHHITETIVVHIPGELHNSVSHNLKTGRGMCKINILASEYLYGDI